MTKKILILGIAVSVFCSCSRLLGGRGSKGISETTGWNITDPEGMFNAKTRYDVQKTGAGLFFIEGGSFVMRRTKEDVMHNWNNTPKRQQVHSFYTDEIEVTNIAYREYLSWLKKVFPPEEAQFSKIWQSALQDTTVWRSSHTYNEVYFNNYLHHPYNYHPVVGVNWLQTNRYAAWRTDRVNERILIKRGYIRKEEAIESRGTDNFSTEVYLDNSSRYSDAPVDQSDSTEPGVLGGFFKRAKKRKGFVNREDDILLSAYRLPTEVEREYAAVVPNCRRIYNIQQGRKSPLAHLRGKRPVQKGDFLANFKRRIGAYSGITGWPNDGAATTCETKKFPASDAGLYDIKGNVAEWVADRYESIIDEKASDLNYYRGNTFTKVMREDGKTAVITEDVTCDTLPNGKLVYHNLPGQILYEKLEDQKKYEVQDERGAQPEVPIKRGYGSDHHYVFRVVKGGYWRDPAERRFSERRQSHLLDRLPLRYG